MTFLPLTKRFLRIEYLLLAVFISAAFSMSLFALHAQAAVTQVIPKTPSDLTAANGWNLTASNSVGDGSGDETDDFTGTSGGTATCVISAGQNLGAVGTTCRVTIPGQPTPTFTIGTDSTLTQTTTTAPTTNSSGQVTGTNYTTAPGPLSPLGQCTSGGSATAIIGGIGGCIVAAVAYFIFQIATTLLGYVGLLFNWVVTLTVFEFGLYFANSPGMLIAWGILRDIGNIVILFGFILMGVMMILDLESFNVRKALPRLLIFAVLLNFSLFASEAVVDVANALSGAFYQAAGGASASNINTNCVTPVGTPNSQCATVGIAGTIITATGLSTLWSPGTTNTLKAIAGPDGAIVLILLALFVSIAAIVLLAGAIMLFVRAITLAFLLVISPLGFAGMAIPPLQKLANQWWKKLISEAFFAPIFLLLIFVALKLTSILQPQSGGVSSFASAITPGQINMGLIFLFLMVFGFMIAALIVAKSFSATGADLAISTSTKVVGTATLGTTGFIGRRTIGAASSGIASSVRSSAIGKTEFGRGVAGVFDRGANASFDARSTKAVQGLAKNKRLPIDLGKPSKAAQHGIHGIEEEATKARTAYADTLKMSDAQRAETARLKTEKNDTDKKFKADIKQLDASVKKATTDSEAAPAKLAELAAQKALLVKESVDHAGFAGDPVARARAEAEIAKIDSQMNDLNQAPAKVTAAKAELKKSQDAYKAELDRINEDLVANDPRLQYAQNIEHDALAQLIPFSVGGHANHEAAKTIKGNATKSDFDKAMETLNKEMKKNTAAVEENTHEEQEAHAAPPPQNNPPAGGGGGNAGGHGPAH